MIDGAERVLRLPTQVTSFALPFGVSIFRLNQGVSWIVGRAVHRKALRHSSHRRAARAARRRVGRDEL